MRHVIAWTLLAFLAVGSAAAQAQSSPPAAETWAKLNFLVGEWQGVGSGAPGEAAGGTTFAFGLDKKILIRKNWAKYPPKPGKHPVFPTRTW